MASAEVGGPTLFKVQSSPHVRGDLTTPRVMADVLIALIPATIVAVYPANIQMAIDATRKGSKLAAVATWLRLPMQFPMLAQALRCTR